YPGVHPAAARGAAAGSEPVRLRPGGEPLRHRPVPARFEGGLRRRGFGGAVEDREQGSHPPVDQGVPREGAVSLSPALAALQRQIEAHARDYGLDFFPVMFEVLDYRKLNQVAAYGGFPTRYPHWRFGMDFEQLQKGYTFGLQRIYEMVINNDPC